MEYLYQYLLFMAQAVTLLVVVVLGIGAAGALASRRQIDMPGHLEVDKLNDQLQDFQHQLEHALLPPAEYKKARKADARAEKQKAKQAGPAGNGEPGARRRLYVLDFEGDLHASRADQLRDEISALMTVARPEDEVVVRLSSPGGLVHSYGFAASQLARIKSHGVRLTVAVDKVAASGGYLMAAVADRILAAPFAVLGSIGVVAQIPNVHRLLKKNDVDVEVMTAGQYKRTLTVFGENTAEGKRKFQEELEDAHDLFKHFLATHRPALDVAAVATGETWYGQRALDLGLIDELSTSDSYLTAACKEADVYKVRWVEKKKPLEKLLGQVQNMAERSIERLLSGLGGRA